MGAHGKVRFLLLCTIYSLRLLSYDNIAMASTIPSGLQARSVIFQSQEKSQSDALSSSMVLYVNVTSAVEVSIAVTTAEGFSSVKNSVVSPGPTVTVGSPKKTLIEAQPSKGAHTAVSFDAASFTSMALSLPQVSVQPTPALTVKPTATSSVNARSVLFQSQEKSQSDALSSSMVLNVNVTSAVEVSIALTATKGFSSVINSVVSPGPTVTVGSPDGTLIEVQPSKGAHTAVSFDAASFTSTVLLSAQVSVQPTPVLTVKSTTTPSLKVDGCKNYKVLNGVDRAQGYTLSAQQRCDSDLELGWYRFQGLAGDQMADTCVPMLRCGTVASGWLSGLHPTVADGVVLRKICYNWLSCCGHSDDIQVRNCGSFFVYELKKPPSCNLRYCGNGSANYMCSPLPAPPNGIKFGCPENAIVYNDTACQFSCNDGYIGSGSQQRRCQPNGTWSGQDFACQIINCTLLTTDPAGPLRISSCDNHYGAQCNFSCAIGYRLKGSSSVRCVAPGNLHLGVWNNAIPRCEAVTCPRLSPPSNGELLGCNTTKMLYKTICGFSCNEGFEAKGSMVRGCTENGTWSGNDLVCDEVDITRNTSAVVNVTEGESLTVNCSIGTDNPFWSRQDGGDVDTKTRKREGVLLRIENASIADTGVYVCKHGNDQHTIWIQVLVQVEVEMELVVENYVFTEELKNKSSPAYKETENNFTTEMDKVHRGVTPGYVRTDVLGFKKGSVQVDFKIVIVLVTNDPENETDLPDVKAETAQRVVVKAKTGFVERLQVKKVIVKTVPLEPANVEFFGIESDELSVRWNPSENADSFQVQRYEVHYRKFEEKLFTNVSQPASDGKTQYTIRIQPLEPETTYMIRVGAANDYGRNFNDESAHKTDPAPFAWWIIVVVVLIILLVLVILVVLIVYKRKRDREREALQQGPRIDALELESAKHEIAVAESKNVKGLSYSYQNDAYKPSEVSWEEIPYENLKLLDELGSGAFGVVYKAEYLQDNGNVLPCAVKSLKPSASTQEVRDLYNELEIMDNVGYHPNLVNLIGACTKDGHLLVVLEIAENGSLIEFLKKNRQTDQSNEIISGLTEQMKTRIATDVARGMAHLAKCRCIHRDLAARNVLLGKDYVAKVSDYGMARDVYEDLMYKKETQGKLPVKWMAIESLQTYIFTIESDVWSYGVLLWEIESGGLKPYAGLNTTELIEALKKGYRLEKPAGCSEDMYQVMRSCWNPNPSARPTFDQLVIQLESEIVT